MDRGKGEELWPFSAFPLQASNHGTTSNYPKCYDIVWRLSLESRKGESGDTFLAKLYSRCVFNNQLSVSKSPRCPDLCCTELGGGDGEVCCVPDMLPGK